MNDENLYATIPSKHLTYWTQSRLDEHIDLLESINRLDKARHETLRDVRRTHFLDYQVDVESDFELELVGQPLRRDSAAILERIFLYLFTVGAYILWDPYLRKEKPGRLRLRVNEKLVTVATIIS